MILSLSLCGAESGTLLLASGTDPSSRAGMHQIPYLSSSHYQPHIWTSRTAFYGWCIAGDGLARMRATGKRSFLDPDGEGVALWDAARHQKTLTRIQGRAIHLLLLVTAAHAAVVG